MATSSVTGKVARRVALYTSGRESLKGEVLSATSSLWFLLFLLLPMVIVVFFGFATINTDLSISYNRQTLDNYRFTLHPLGIVTRLTIRTVLVAVVASADVFASSVAISSSLAHLCSANQRLT